ncbi:MAG: tRNA (adenosine(37)-N6)-dimethylallyltransferase MiaA [Chloroflexi bacterium]|nr:MAG: tRNA (adenosine(37)-N6)-dimethylallyltransferase MiaA [Chloroflexota bacterium]MBL1195869.1 tRNA (adenosine(37)-N6)-dimethylallyltransferase MiaA [Chloroflexota bacterium]NOH13161.1 tRNA (adenosine(37)-N6)-dimethylallyltransferase MiaA [Chloroflexota bacterium]
MPLADPRPPLIVILGPTAVGKTAISIELAQRLDAEIISVDSRLFYRGMDIGTAKPTFHERRTVPHHLIDVADPDETWSLALFQHQAMDIIEDIHAKGRLPFLVGGTGQYIRAITEGWNIPEQAPDESMRNALEAWGSKIGADGLYQRLQVLDSNAAANIDARNLRRTVRALEVTLRTGVRFSEQRQKGEAPYNVLQIGLTRPRPELYERIDQRIENMLTNGFVGEVQALLDKGYSRDIPSMSAIGYTQIAAHLQGETTLEEAVVEIKRLTRQFVRRQANWFKPTDPDIHWFEMGNDTGDAVEDTVRSFIR